jgi:hypothetical protein
LSILADSQYHIFFSHTRIHKTVNTLMTDVIKSWPYSFPKGSTLECYKDDPRWLAWQIILQNIAEMQDGTLRELLIAFPALLPMCPSTLGPMCLLGQKPPPLPISYCIPLDAPTSERVGFKRVVTDTHEAKILNRDKMLDKFDAWCFMLMIAHGDSIKPLAVVLTNHKYATVLGETVDLGNVVIQTSKIPRAEYDFIKCVWLYSNKLKPEKDFM